MAIKLVSREYVPFTDDYKCDYIVDTDNDFKDLPTVGTGSSAVSVETGKVLVVNASGEWAVFGG